MAERRERLVRSCQISWRVSRYMSDNCAGNRYTSPYTIANATSRWVLPSPSASSKVTPTSVPPSFSRATDSFLVHTTKPSVYGMWQPASKHTALKRKRSPAWTSFLRTKCWLLGSMTSAGCKYSPLSHGPSSKRYKVTCMVSEVLL